ncbi:hypothetical protein [Ruminococcus albus]|uniref:Uncharacterized protein n=1 Tax=Ruminococcus albus SY3 TaxID=1341156 RepID=A0A011VVT0_RUMAL|nr:hypothetical protein [Ruminococcus albus]EXM38708.1 hypothetical protein RASY3_18705 [Ruminococcus albus SY3]EXM40222.1 hypothetical protein RASY3_08320 [Ruminococcus albus SY3]
MLFFGKKKKDKTRHSPQYYVVNDWCKEHENEIAEIRNYISMEVAQGKRLSSALLIEACLERSISMPFPYKDLLKYGRVRLF